MYYFKRLQIKNILSAGRWLANSERKNWLSFKNIKGWKQWNARKIKISNNAIVHMSRAAEKVSAATA